MRVPVICGPTGSGKSAFAAELALRLGGEVIAADCMTVYRGADIGTAKPTKAEMRGVPHHMIDVASPKEPYSVADYERAALPLCNALRAAGKVPIVCGGTGFYIRSLLFVRTNGGAGADAAIRKKYEAYAAERGNAALHALLASVDAESAAKLHPNDVKRVIRALEIYDLTGQKKSAQQDGDVPRFPYFAAAFDYPRQELYARIDARVDAMLDAGLVDEVERLLKDGVPPNSQCMQGIGYKEVVQYLKNEITHSTMRNIIQQNSRNYAKRQLTFFKKLPGIVWLDPNDTTNLEKCVKAVWEK